MLHPASLRLLSFFFFNDTATTEIYTLSLHDALPISTTVPSRRSPSLMPWRGSHARPASATTASDRKSTRLNSSHVRISYAVFCLKKKTKNALSLHRDRETGNRRGDRHHRIDFNQGMA